MTLKADGTNGILQQYDYQVLTTGFTYTFAAGTTVLVINPAGTLATGTITFPAAPVDGMTVTFSSTQTITALTLSGNSKTIVSAATILPANQATTYVYRLSNTSWYPMTNVATNTFTSPTLTSPTITGAVVSSMASSVLTLGTTQASTSGTSIDFTGIPSWVKRVTVMIEGVSTSGSSIVVIQVGNGSILTTTYTGLAAACSNGGGFAVTSSPGSYWPTEAASGVSASSSRYGTHVITRSGNTWFINGQQQIPAIWQSCVGAAAPGTSIDRIRITTANGTDTFDAGSINILYE